MRVYVDCGGYQGVECGGYQGRGVHVKGGCLGVACIITTKSRLHDQAIVGSYADASVRGAAVSCHAYCMLLAHKPVCHVVLQDFQEKDYNVKRAGGATCCSLRCH